MNSQRFIQVLQELINNQNSLVSSANSYLYEAQMSSYNSYDQQAYQSLQNENSDLNRRINDMSYVIQQLQNDNYNLTNNVNSAVASTAELDSLRNLVNALTSDKDYLQSQLSFKDQQITETNSVLSNKDSQLGEAMSTISALQSSIAELNSKLSDALASLDQKQADYMSANDRAASLQAAVDIVKSKVAAELQEAMKDIDQALDENIK